MPRLIRFQAIGMPRDALYLRDAYPGPPAGAHTTCEWIHIYQAQSLHHQTRKAALRKRLNELCSVTAGGPDLVCLKHQVWRSASTCPLVSISTASEIVQHHLVGHMKLLAPNSQELALLLYPIGILNFQREICKRASFCSTRSAHRAVRETVDSSVLRYDLKRSSRTAPND